MPGTGPAEVLSGSQQRQEYEVPALETATAESVFAREDFCHDVQDSPLIAGCAVELPRIL